MELVGTNLITMDALDRPAIERVLALAAALEPYARGERVTEVLRGAVLVSLFFEPSTRTRLSFATAFARLGGTTLSVVDAGTSSIAKGESLPDTGRVVSGYGDLIAMRHPRVGAVAELAQGASVPVVSGGDGTGEHPTQALLDLYALQRERGRLDGLHVALVGDLRHGRTTHSLARALARFDDVTLTLVAPDELQLPEHLAIEVADRGVNLRFADRLEGALAEVDAVYMTRLQEERFESKDQAARHRGQLALDLATYRRLCAPGTPLLHPLPRDGRPGARELSTDLDMLPELAIFRQAAGGVAVRMALFALLLGVDEQVHDHSRPATWAAARSRR
jgi:aspartate carbamoyltransferase catalytic subunit